MQNRTIVALGVAALLVVGGVFVFDVFFAAEASTQAADTALPEGAVVLSEGRFEGKAGHDVSGRVQLVELDGEHYLIQGERVPRFRAGVNPTSFSPNCVLMLTEVVPSVTHWAKVGGWIDVRPSVWSIRHLRPDTRPPTRAWKHGNQNANLARVSVTVVAER
jgi:hypothetical protein